MSDIVSTRLIRTAATGGALLFLLTFAGCEAMSHSVTVQGGDVGIQYNQFGANAGVQATPLQPGWHLLGIGEKVVTVWPTRERPYAFSQGSDQSSKEDEELCFPDKTGLQICGDINVYMRTLPTAAPGLYNKWRMAFDDLLRGPIRNDIKAELAKQTEVLPFTCQTRTDPNGAPLPADPSCQQILGPGRQAILQRATTAVAAKWAKDGLIITNAEWLGNLRPPEAITNSITQRQQAEQDTAVSQQKTAQAQAEADRKIAIARGDAESTKLRAQAISSNPQILREKEIERWSGLCPLDTKVCIIGASAMPQVQADGGQ